VKQSSAKFPATQAITISTQLLAVLREDVTVYPEDKELELFLGHFLKTFGNNLLAVIFFGSCLSEKTRTETSFKDFFLVVDSYRRASSSLLAALGHNILPPDLYHFEIPLERGQKAECKYYLISGKDFIRATGPGAKDLYVMGRLSKRVGLVYSKDEKTFDLILQCLASSGIETARYSSSFIQETLILDDFIRLVLDLSYRSERRIEAGEFKAESLFNAAPSYYNKVYSLIVRQFIDEKILVQNQQGKLQAGPHALAKTQAEKFINQSRTRAKMRWPKMILTVDNWLDQLLAKFERTYNIRLEIPPWERKVILITGWRHYFRAKREGKLH
jgi:hypothetical protein